MSEGRSFEQVVSDVADATRLVGRQWMEWFDVEPGAARARVEGIIAQGLIEIEAGAEFFGTGGIELQRDAESGNIRVMVIIGTKWDPDDTGEPEWT